MRGENRPLPWLASETAKLIEDVFDDIDMGKVNDKTLRAAKLIRDYAICIVDKLQERGGR